MLAVLNGQVMAANTFPPDTGRGKSCTLLEVKRHSELIDIHTRVGYALTGFPPATVTLRMMYSHLSLTSLL